ncbi:MAG TPA: spore germination protein GerW family protein [Terriglobales bacterium]|nr:spore germination protein GerW family protein [Terriglobales bacterium]
MAATSLIQSLRDSFANHAGVKTLYGDPIEAQGKTVVPVARISYGFGAGAGSRGGDESNGGGGGGGLSCIPTGFIEITPQASRFVAITPNRKLAGAAALGMMVGLFLGRRRRKH